MLRTVSAAALYVGVAVLLVSQAPPTRVHPGVQHGCKPDAPVRVEVTDVVRSAGVTRIEYRLQPVLAARAVAAEALLPDGGVVLSHARAAAADVAPGATVRGALRVRFPSGRPDARVVIRGSITFAAGPGLLETSWTERILTAGDAPPRVDLPRVRSGDLTTRDVPRVPSAGGGR